MRVVKTMKQDINAQHFFERILSVSEESIELEMNWADISWSDFLLNPRRLRGSDFLMRWSQGVWSEDRILQAVNETDKYHAIHYGPSGTAPDKDVREYELYFERLERAGLGKHKRPDILIFKKQDKIFVEEKVRELGGLQELPFILEEDPGMKMLLSKALVAIECENSLWIAGKMPDFGTTLSPQSRLGGKLGLKKTAILPTIIIKEEDRTPLREWQKKNMVPIHIWHVFYDMAFGIALDKIEELIKNGQIQPTEQIFQAPGGATTKKIIYKVYYQYGYLLGASGEKATLVADHIVDKNGHILPYVKFHGGNLTLSKDALEALDSVSGR